MEFKYPEGFQPFSYPQGYEPQPDNTQPLPEYISGLKGRLGRDLTKEDILADERLMSVVDRSVDTRFQDRSFVAGGVTGLLGGATSQGYRPDLSPEERFEIFQNYQRSFAGGQTVTTANELAFIVRADDATKAAVGEGYELFDSMGNIFTGEGTWSETFDGVGDYIRAGLVDPTTVATAAVGRLLSQGTARASAMAVREAAKLTAKQVAEQAATKVGTEAAKKAAQEAAKIAAQKTFKQIGLEAGKKVVQFGAIDAGAAIASDLGYQKVLMDTGVQEAYNPAQTALAGLSIAAVPALIKAGQITAAAASKIPGVSSLIPKFEGIVRATAGKTSKEKEAAVRNTIDWDTLSEGMRETFSKFKENMEAGLEWTPAKRKSAEIVSEGATDVSGIRNDVNGFFEFFMFGGVDADGVIHDGFANKLKEAGFVYIPRWSDDKPTNWLGDALSWLPDDLAREAIETFEFSTGAKLGIDLTENVSDQLSSVWRLTASEGGLRLYLSRKATDILDGGVDILDPTGSASAKAKEASRPERMKYIQSVWKRLLTAHFGTTGANVKGWYQLYTMNTISDAVQGVLEMATSPIGKSGQLKRGWNTLLSSARRMGALLDPQSSMDEAEAFFVMNPEYAKEVFRELSGDVGAKDAPERFNMLRETVVGGKKVTTPMSGVKTTEDIVHGLQTATGVVLQDELTKQVSFMMALDRELLRSYGKTYSEFFALEDAFIRMKQDDFAMVVSRAIDRTLRETASKTWGTHSYKGNLPREFARIVEGASNNEFFGYAIPFGRFFNTTIATLGDFTSINFVRHYLKKARGVRINPAEEEGFELFAKGVVGLAGITFAAHHAAEKIDQGLAWNQERREDGTISDKTFDFPESHMRIIGQLFGHVIHEMGNTGKSFSEALPAIPRDLATEAGAILGGQTFRAGQEGIQAMTQMAIDMLEGNLEAGGEKALEMLLGFGANIVSGVTRPLEPLNEIAGAVTGNFSNPDRRQGVKFLNEAFRYVDKIIPMGDRSERAYPTRGTSVPKDYGRVLGGVRSSPEPNLTEKVLNSVGMPHWRSVRWDGPPEVKNRLDEIFDIVVHARFNQLLIDEPDFFEKPTEAREILTKRALEESKKHALDLLESQAGSDQSVAIIRKISSNPKGERGVKQVLDYLGYEGDLADIATEEGGKLKLETILYMVQNWEEFVVK